MDIKDIAREKILVEMLTERDQMILNLFQELQELKRQLKEMEKEKQNEYAN